jgi:hypothetical protein
MDKQWDKHAVPIKHVKNSWINFHYKRISVPQWPVARQLLNFWYYVTLWSRKEEHFTADTERIGSRERDVTTITLISFSLPPPHPHSITSRSAQITLYMKDWRNQLVNSAQRGKCKSRLFISTRIEDFSETCYTTYFRLKLNGRCDVGRQIKKNLTLCVCWFIATVVICVI